VQPFSDGLTFVLGFVCVGIAIAAFYRLFKGPDGRRPDSRKSRE